MSTYVVTYLYTPSTPCMQQIRRRLISPGDTSLWSKPHCILVNPGGSIPRSPASLYNFSKLESQHTVREGYASVLNGGR